jgi:two-component system, chemotaxis family, sensor kinase CheA
MNLVSELVTTQARLSLFAEQNGLTELISIAENVEKISRRLRDNTFSICLVPLESILIRFQRLVRDLSVELKKDIILLTEGTDTELDKSVIESLADTLLHILRNSIDHGIEDENIRLQKGKPKQGKILLKAFYSGTHVHIQIQDDGAGIHPQKIRQKAISKGLISADSVLSEREILDLIFMPGFSTAEMVTDVSGRGVGMDVVRRKITELRGEVDIQSQVDRGTTLTIKLPLMLSIVDGLLVSIEDTHFVIPLSVVDKCFEAEHTQLVSTFNNLITLDNEKLPFFYLRKEFKMNKNFPVIEQIVMVKYDGNRVGLVVDAVIGEYQAVLKPLGRWYKHQDHISGATILGDGTIALVMDTTKMIKQFIKSENLTI